ncbi:MAG TPA: IS66 family transposase [Pyrinomonadaceae bacterium]|nr:IS66 family transposase [Pyrinomonadaceae bacterium]
MKLSIDERIEAENVRSHQMQETFFSSSDDLVQKLESAVATIATLEERVRVYQDENNWLKEQIADLKRNRFGKKSEGYETPEQVCLFNEAEIESRKPDPTDDEEADQTREVKVEGHTKNVRGHRKALPENLEREVIKIELPEEEQFDEDGNRLKVIGWEISEKIKYEPSRISVTQYQRAKYGVEQGDYVKTAPPVASIIPKSNATPELLAAIVVAKYADGLPLYRMEDFFKRHGIELGRQTMARWVIQVAGACAPILNVLSNRWINSFYVALDETKVQVLKESGRKAESDSWMIVRSIPYGEKKVILFDYRTSRGSEAMNKLLEGFKGFMQVDGLSSYDEASRNADVTRLGCGMHSRRRFEKAFVTGLKSGKSLGEVGLKYFKDLYAIEDELRDKSTEERHCVRLEKAKPIWEAMKAWAEKKKGKVPKQGQIGNALNYLLNEYEFLTNYLLDGRLEIDNGFTERAIRKFAIGRNNWLFSDTEDGANASALLYSLVVTAKVNGVNPYKALVTLFTQLPLAKTDEDYTRLADLILAP